METEAPLTELLQTIERDVTKLDPGAVATYIPELAKADPESFALVVRDTGGELLSAGLARQHFTIQSVCKPFLFAAALDLFGRERTLSAVGVEPTGDAFDSIIRLDAGANKPHNPMVNAGAIALSSLFVEADHGIDYMLDLFRRLAAQDEIVVDVPVYLSESVAGDRNRAIAHLMKHLGMIGADTDATLDLYFQLCSVRVCAEDLATMGAVLATGGLNQLTGDEVFDRETVRDVLTVMSTCGLYDHAGRFMFDVGLPAKSGVSGGLLAVVPGRMAVAAYGPGLDSKGSSVRGQAAVTQLSRELHLHTFRVTDRHTSFTDRTRDTASHISDALSEVVGEDFGESGGSACAYLSHSDLDARAAAVCTVGGDEYQDGDSEVQFSMQSACNPFTYALAATMSGLDRVHQAVDVEPSGNPYNAIVLRTRGRPANPLGNAGAIAVASLVAGDGPVESARRLSTFLGELACSDPLDFDAAVLAAERREGERNRAIAYLLKNFRVIDDVEPALATYFQQCSVRVNVKLLARMAGTLAFGGKCPCCGKRLVEPDIVRAVLSVMYSTGMHDQSGMFAFEVGLPAKSGISGAILAVVPQRMGVAVYSPPVNASGTSVVGARMLKSLSSRLRLGTFAS